MALSRFVLNSKIAVTITWPATWSEIVNGPAAPAVTTPAVPAASTNVFNNNGFPVVVTVTGGTGVAISVNGTATGSATGPVTVPAGGTINLGAYTVAPTSWAWAAAATGPEPGGFGAMNVGNPAPAGGQLGNPGQVFFMPGQVIWADSSAGNSGPQQLYQAIGAGNLRAWVDGQDTVGHAALAN